MEQYRKMTFETHGLEALHSFTAPGVSWQAMLKKTKCNLELMTDIDMCLMIQSGIRGGITQSATRHVKANNKYLPDYDKDKESIFLGYFDCNNMYAVPMVKTPIG